MFIGFFFLAPHTPSCRVIPLVCFLFGFCFFPERVSFAFSKFRFLNPPPFLASGVFWSVLPKRFTPACFFFLLKPGASFHPAGASHSLRRIFPLPFYPPLLSYIFRWYAVVLLRASHLTPIPPTEGRFPWGPCFFMTWLFLIGFFFSAILLFPPPP